MKKRLMSILLSLFLLLGLLSGCGSTEPASAAAPAEPAAASAEEEPIAPEEPVSIQEPEESILEEPSLVEEEPVYTVTYPLTDTPETLSLYCTACNFMGPLSSVSMDWEDFDVYKELEELTGVHIDFEAVSFESYTSSYNIYIAGGDYADLLININSGYVGGASAAYEAGVIQDLTPYLAEYAPDYYAMLESDPLLHEAAYTKEGRVLRFIAAYDSAGIKNGGIIRGDWADALNIEVKDFDSLHEYLLGAKNQFGASVPVYMTQSAAEYETAFNIVKYGVGGGDLGFFVQDGTIKSPLNETAYRDYLTEMHKWYDEGLLYRDFATASFDPHNNTLNQMIYNGDVAVWATMLEGLDDYDANGTDPNFRSLPIPEVTITGEKNHCTEVEYAIGDSDICVSTNCDNLPLAISWMNYWYTEEGIRAYNYGVEGEAYHLEDGKVVLEDFVLNNEYGVDVSSFLRMYCPYGSFVGVYLRSRLEDYSSALQKQAQKIWTESNDGAYVIPDGVTLDVTANETIASLGSDITTYADTMVPKFIMGDADIDAEWDTFVKTMEDMGLTQCIQLEQEAYDDYVAATQD